MTKRIEISENGLYLVLAIEADLDVLLLHFGAIPFDEATIKPAQKPGFRLLEVQLSGEDRAEYHGRSHRASFPGLRLKYASHHDYRNATGRKFEVVLVDPITHLEAISHFQFYD
jgi:alpha-galactosidase